MLLQVVALVVLPHPSIAANAHVGPLICQYLGPSPHLSLHKAATYGSIPLLEWIWDASATSVSSRISRWTLCNFLRSEPYYTEYEFREGVRVASRLGDLAMVQWVLDHFQGFEIPSEVVTEAAKNGHLSVVKFLWEHDQGHAYRHEVNKWS
ncbi:hypothetical protein PC128_g2805 [Phytophthora cactorum]|nr:hypothetical protein PC120_g10104 [Phytophthora cactorum]KAG3203049.1 hypothetical protein PC128_g2805 [Phytophthora cactorum]KAG4060590.1 hypothetical protein PC123_g4512 [Phytophthora cactorum]